MTYTTYTTCTTCRVCGSANLTPLFSLGEQFVSDFVPADKVKAGHVCPIELDLCNDCSLVQARHTAPQDLLYTRRYWFRSGVTATLRAALKDVADAAQRLVSLQPGDVVLDIGANDGTGLRAFDAPGIVRVACEPASNLAEECRTACDCLIPDFWNYAAYRTALYYDRETKRWELLPRAKVITAIGMAYDLEDANPFVADIAKALAPNGVCIWQLMCLRQMFDKWDVGNLAHEHLEYYSLASLDYLFKRHGLQIFDVEENDVNGGSYRLYCGHRENKFRFPDGLRRIEAARLAEAEMGLASPDAYRRWFARVQANRDACVDFLRSERALGKRIHVLGASTKGNVLLQWMNLDGTLIEAASERSPEKCGLHTIGTGIKIVSEEESRAMKPDLYLVLPYAFRNEIVEREREFLERGGVFVVPLPCAHTVRAMPSMGGVPMIEERPL